MRGDGIADGDTDDCADCDTDGRSFGSADCCADIDAHSITYFGAVGYADHCPDLCADSCTHHLSHRRAVCTALH